MTPSDRPLSIVERLLVLRKLEAFESGSTQALVSLAEIASERRHAPGEVLFREGDRADEFLMIADGEVAIEHKSPPLKVTRSAGDLVENFSAFGSTERKFTATTTSAVHLLVLNREDLYDQMEAHFELTRSVMRFLAIEIEKVNRVRAETEKHQALPAS